jgi:hypothetical protein
MVINTGELQMKQIKVGGWRYNKSNQTILFTIPDNVNEYEIDLEGGCGTQFDMALHLVETRLWFNIEMMNDYWTILSKIKILNPTLKFFKTEASWIREKIARMGETKFKELVFYHD